MKKAYLLTLPAALACLAVPLYLPAQDTSGKGAAVPAKMSQSCDALAAKLAYADTTFSTVATVDAGRLHSGARAIGEHCQIVGKMHQRTSPVDQQTYAINFEMRLPKAWNGRFFYQANDGLDGSVVTATGDIGGGGEQNSALGMGFAVISSDAGHEGDQNPLFGLDPQARLDYGYRAVQVLTAMAKQVIAVAYGKGPDTSYFGGCSNGGRHAMVAAARDAANYDGILAGDPGFHLPKAALAAMATAQQLAALSDGHDVASGLTAAERRLVGDAILARCDALDGAKDSMVQDVAACQRNFDLGRDVPTCGSAGRTGSCLTAAQKQAVGAIYAGARDGADGALYASFPYDPGVSSGDWANWRQSASLTLVPASVAFEFMSPPADRSAEQDLAGYALGFNFARDAAKIFATSGVYTTSAWDYMTPPHETDLSALKARGGKLLIYHGTGDAIFSFDDTAAWYTQLTIANDGKASDFARLFPVPGMSHCAGGPATDQFDALTPLIAWVEHGQAPAAITAAARSENGEVPSQWGKGRTRPLCPYPQVARYVGGNVDSAASFSCR
ncbi:tannase/feruloyl esterase family alpha/beta hydrolase [Xanthomonas vasicola]|uniref:tannase/feruloyl esterase family alpha/beta hydrolase n=2 Tax=Xanthomonas vasicola TaxID=56459 RepID=UPI00053132B2|nr:tannase/feruloyl esterase family alpha/beta hydrolase [Xanthomonas vasicola]AZR36583.1 tannase/feruloyl esterase family alpha/beta hydrolase [Xanthomonas vasicola]KGR51932.1 esterase [Xanthomonas vasicola]KGR54676.1 esterase [Xanthomonas vasicola]KGT85497.1 esterase [Xanthomonas vasicola]